MTELHCNLKMRCKMDQKDSLQSVPKSVAYWCSQTIDQVVTVQKSQEMKIIKVLVIYLPKKIENKANKTLTLKTITK